MGTNHWGKPIMPGGPIKTHPSPEMEKVIKNPILVYSITNFTPEKNSFLINGSFEEERKNRCVMQ